MREFSQGRSDRRDLSFYMTYVQLGPGFVSGAADDDPSGLMTYTLAGARFGTMFLWTALATWPLMAGVQMACSRVGLATGRGLARALQNKIPRPLLWLMTLALLIANALNIAADLAAMSDGVRILFGVPTIVTIAVLTVILLASALALRYEQIARLLTGLAFSLLAYVAVVLMVHVNWPDAVRSTLCPRWPQNVAEWSMLVALLGTTISPYLLYWQASHEVEECAARGAPSEIIKRKWDVGIGTFFSNLVMYCVILASAMTLHRAGLSEITSVEDASLALKPLAGEFATGLFVLGLIAVGLLAIPTLSGSAAYACAEICGWPCGFNKTYREAKGFYVVIVLTTISGAIWSGFRIDPVRALYYSAVLNGLLAPIVLGALFFIIRDRGLMAERGSSRLGQFAVGLSALLMGGAALGLFLATD